MMFEADWQRIETAPRDGTSILVCAPTAGGDCGYAVVCWQWTGMGAIAGGWCLSDEFRLSERPSHWMPLPLNPGTPEFRRGVPRVVPFWNGSPA